ncbi:MAG: YfhO family protein [Bacilli bacterium]
MNKNKQAIFITSFISFALFFVFALLARPRLVVYNTPLNIVIFSLLALPIVIFSLLNIIKVFSKTKRYRQILDLMMPLLILFPLYLGATGYISLFQSVILDIWPFITFGFVLSFLVAYASNLLFLINQYKEKVETTSDIVEETSQKVQGFFNRLNDDEWPLYKYVIYLFIIAILFFIYPLFTEQFTIPLGGDYTQQQIPFYTNGYDDWWRFLKTGQFPLWDSNTFLGANNIGSNAFYYSINPFFLPILLFPRDLIPQGIAVLMITKFVLAALSMRLYLKYMGVKENSARLFAFMFAFSGWNTYNLWFNHFMEVAVVFPLIFLGIEKIFKEKSPYLLIVGLGLMGLANYFFLVTVSFLGVIYAGFRYFQLLPKFKLADHPKILGLGILGFALGILAGGAALFPGISVSMFSDRVTGATYLETLKTLIENKEFAEAWKHISEWTAQSESYEHKVYYPLITFFFPVLSNRSASLLNTSSYDNTISSIFAFTPIIILLVPSIINSFKTKKFSHFIAIAFFIFSLFTPFMYNALHGFTNEYGRWQLFVTFALVTYVALSFEKRETYQRWYFDLSFVFVATMMGFTYLWAFNYQNTNGFGFLEYRELVVFYQFLIVVIVYLLFRFSFASKNVHQPLQVILTLEAVVMGTITMIGHGFISYTGSTSGGLTNYNNDVEVIRAIQALDGDYYRVSASQSYKGNDNYPMRVGYNGLSTFHSLYNFELMQFNHWSKVNYNYNGWSLGLGEKRLFLNHFLNVKYYVETEKENVINFYRGGEVVDSINVQRPNVPVTHDLLDHYDEQDRYVYQNSSTFQFGFGVDQIMPYERPNLLVEGEMIDYFANTSIQTIVKNEEFYLQSGIVSLDDFEEIALNYPHLEQKSYNSMPLNYTELWTGSGNLSRRLVKTFYACVESSYPYKNPTEENISNACQVSTSTGTLRSGDGIEYTLANGDMLLPEGGYLMLQWPVSSRVRVFLYDENDEVITFEDVYNSNSSRYYKLFRGMHSLVPVKKLTVVPIGEQYNENSSYIFSYSPNQISSVISQSEEYPLSEVKVTTNAITFKTNYEEEKFIVTTIPYDKGWNVRSIKSDRSGTGLKVYKTHGGFVGFMSEKGEVSYEMSFMPEYFMVGSLTTVVGFYIGIAGLIITERKKKKARAV